MARVLNVALVCVALLALYSSSLDVASSGVDIFSVSMQRYELAELSRQIDLFAHQYARLPTKDEFPDFCRQRMRTPMRDAAADRWGKPIWYENVEYEGRKLNFPADVREYVLVSAGPDQAWLTQDDLVLTRFAVPGVTGALESH